jgi:hypothetical protein
VSSEDYGTLPPQTKIPFRLSPSRPSPPPVPFRYQYFFCKYREHTWCFLSVLIRNKKSGNLSHITQTRQSLLSNCKVLLSHSHCSFLLPKPSKIAPKTNYNSSSIISFFNYTPNIIFFTPHIHRNTAQKPEILQGTKNIL